MKPEDITPPVWFGVTLVSWIMLGVFIACVRRIGLGGGPRPAIGAVLAGNVFVWVAGFDQVPLIWPLISGWGWLFAACVVTLAVQAANYARRSNKGMVVPALGIILFALPAWVTRGEASLLLGSVPLGHLGNFKLLAVLVVLILGAQWAGGWQAGRRKGGSILVYALLVAGAILFSVPFFWLLLTSFKEERDMTNANGLVWIPKVTRMARALDPLSPLYETDYQGQKVQVEKRATEGSGIRVSVVLPVSLAGSSLVVLPTALKEVPREMKVVIANLGGQKVEALLLDEDGKGAHIQVTKPESRKGEMAILSTTEVEPIRETGLLWKNYSDALAALPSESQGGLRYLENTLFLCFMSVLGTVLSCTVVAYGFARLRFPGRGFLFGLLLATMMLPGAVTMLPSFLIFRELGWIDSLTPLWAPAFLGSAFNIFLLRQFFLTLPKELEDAAKIDGCGHLRTLWSVMAPQIKPALVVVGIWTFIGAWNNFMGPLIYVSSSEKMTIAYAMQLFAGDKAGQPGLLMAFATMALMPVVLLFFLAQRAFVEGIALTGRTG